jgi:hypothetical protein
VTIVAVAMVALNARSLESAHRIATQRFKVALEMETAGAEMMGMETMVAVPAKVLIAVIIIRVAQAVLPMAVRQRPMGRRATRLTLSQVISINDRWI